MANRAIHQSSSIAGSDRIGWFHGMRPWQLPLKAGCPHPAPSSSAAWGHAAFNQDRLSNLDPETPGTWNPPSPPLGIGIAIGIGIESGKPSSQSPSRGDESIAAPKSVSKGAPVTKDQPTPPPGACPFVQALLACDQIQQRLPMNASQQAFKAACALYHRIWVACMLAAFLGVVVPHSVRAQGSIDLV
jgi:hypothetical protein